MNDPKRPTLELFTDFHEVTSTLQIEMSKELVTGKQATKRLEAQLKQSDAAQMLILRQAADAFISFFPLAQMNRVNLTSMVFALHSNLTGDDTLHEIYEEINRRALGLPESTDEPD
jgi:hypothetical protein